MKTKMFEIRDRATCMVVAAMKTKGESVAEGRLLKRAGWDENSVILCSIDGGSEATHDPFVWRKNGNNTLFQAHLYLQKHFESLEDNSVIDIEFIAGKTDKPKESEIINNPFYD